jgi:thiamine pyrophosphokinase
VVVVAGGGPPDAAVLDRLPSPAFVVAADSGVDTALALGLRIDLVVGDLDSVTPAGLAAAEASGARVVRHPVAKDATDLVLAMHEAMALLGDDGDDGELVVVGGSGGRLDHLLAGALALADPAFAGVEVRAHLGPATIHVVHGPGARVLGGDVGDLLTLVPVGGRADGVRTTGLRYPLRDEPLEPASTRGVSNVVESVPASVRLTTGALLAVLPGDTDDGGPP